MQLDGVAGREVPAPQVGLGPGRGRAREPRRQDRRRHGTWHRGGSPTCTAITTSPNKNAPADIPPSSIPAIAAPTPGSV